MPPIPIAMCGKNPQLATMFSKKMLPEYQVVHHFQSTGAFRKDFPPLMRGENIKPQAGCTGTNADSSASTRPKAMFVGGGFSDAELHEMMEVSEARSIPFVAPDPDRQSEVPQGQGFPMDHIVSRVKTCMEKNGLVEGSEESVRPGLWRH